MCRFCSNPKCLFTDEYTWDELRNIHQMANSMRTTEDQCKIFELKNYIKRMVPSDGNCFFHCLAKFLNNSETHETLREKIAVFIINNDELQSTLKACDPDEFDSDLVKLMSDGQYNFALFDSIPYIMSDMLKINIEVHPIESVFKVNGATETVHLYLKNDHYTLLEPREEEKPKEEKPKEKKTKVVREKKQTNKQRVQVQVQAQAQTV